MLRNPSVRRCSTRGGEEFRLAGFPPLSEGRRQSLVRTAFLPLQISRPLRASRGKASRALLLVQGRPLTGQLVCSVFGVPGAAFSTSFIPGPQSPVLALAAWLNSSVLTILDGAFKMGHASIKQKVRWGAVLEWPCTCFRSCSWRDIGHK